MGEITINPLHNVHKKYRDMHLVNPYRFAPAIPPFVSTWNTANTSSGSSTSTQVKLPLISAGTYNFVVQWGDGNSDTITVWNQAQTTHTYATSGTYTITITGICTGFQFNNTGDRLKFLSIQSFGILKINNSNGFSGCSNLTLSSVSDVLDCKNSILQGLFLNCTSLGVIALSNTWDVSFNTSFNQMFKGCPSFNSNISSWNTSSATGITGMFTNCTSFNQNIGSWNVSNCTSLLEVFSGCTNFNQNIGSWNVSNCTSLSGTFTSCTSFNQNIGNWNVAKVTNMNSTFAGCAAFNNGGNSSISSWTTTLLNNCASTFSGCTNFNQPINWNMSSVTTMDSMFGSNAYGGSTSFNQNIGSWNVSNCTSFRYMFVYCTAFNNGGNSSISSWTTTLLNNCFATFYGCTNFNQPINWNMSNVTTMYYMFGYCTSFNQNIGSWNVSKVTAMNDFMIGKSAANFSSANLDAIYNGWSALAGGVKPSININFGTIKYTAGASAGRAILTGAPNNWVITDGGI